jgi:hypothetical protein
MLTRMDMSSALERIDHRGRLESVFGRWPSFHDFEVIRIAIDRSGDLGPTLSVEIYGFVTSQALDQNGYYRREPEVSMLLEFYRVEINRLEGLNRQNVIASLDFDWDGDSGERRVRAIIQPLYGLGAEFTFDHAVVRDVRPHQSTTSS